jgi:hypothetical protein
MVALGLRFLVLDYRLLIPGAYDINICGHLRDFLRPNGGYIAFRNCTALEGYPRELD